MTEQLHSIDGVEIFKVGRHNGDTYTDRDLQDMIDAFDHVGYRPPIKLGHDEKSGDRSFGWIKRIYRRGSTLFADLMDVPASVYNLIKDRAYDAVSSEIYWDIERNGKKFRRALKGLALIGAEIPGCAGLAPLRSVVNAMKNSGHLHYTFHTKERHMTTNTDPGAAIVEMTNTYHHQHPTLSWHQCFDHIRNSDAGKQALRLYGQRRTVIEQDDFDLYEGESASAVIHSQAEKRAKAEKIPYRDAVVKVLAEDAGLKRAYAARR